MAGRHVPVADRDRVEGSAGDGPLARPPAAQAGHGPGRLMHGRNGAVRLGAAPPGRGDPEIGPLLRPYAAGEIDQPAVVDCPCGDENVVVRRAATVHATVRAPAASLRAGSAAYEPIVRISIRPRLASFAAYSRNHASVVSCSSRR